MALYPAPEPITQSSNTAPRPPAPKVGPVFKITFEYGCSGIGTGLTGKVVGMYSPSTAWTAHIGRGPSLVQSITGSKRIDDSSPAAMYAALGNIAATRPEDLLQFYQSSYSGSFTTDNGCSLSDSGSERPDTSSAWLTRTKDGATLQFRTMELGDVNSKCDQWDGTFLMNFGPADSEKMEEFFTFRLSNKDLANFGTIEKTNSCSLKAEGVNPGTAWGKATLTADIQPPEGEVIVEPDGYDNWIPKGNMDNPEKRGNNLSVRVSVQNKQGSGRPPRAKLVFTLQKVSMQKGVCMNWPRKTAKTDYGLKFLQEENPDLDVVGPDEARTKEYVDDARIEISAFDFGAWGILRITAKDELGRDLKIKVRGQDKSEMSIPLDENHNHIADAWETQWAGGLRGQESDDEDAEPQGDGDTGDVLSLYEEYRGFRISGGAEATASGGVPHELFTGYHVRTDPRVKDVFVCDTLGYGIAAFRVSGLQVHLLKAEECGTSKSGAFNTHIINPNHGSWSKGEQYVLWMESGNPGTGYAGVAIMKGGNPSVPRDCQKIVVGAPSTGGSRLMSADEETRVTITHELAHACNVKHHGTVTLVDFIRGEQLSDHSVFNESGTISAAKDSVAGGDTHCFMAYQANLYEDQKNPEWWVWDATGKRYAGTKWMETSPRFAKYRFCDIPSTWELGPGGPPSPQRGDCNHQFCVNHLKH